MKKLLQIIWVLFIAWLLMWGFRTFWPDIYFQWLQTDGDSPSLVLSWEKVYVSELVWAYAYLSDGTPTTTTSDETRYPISWTFTNEVIYWFVASGVDMIKYQGSDKRIRFVLNRYGTTDTFATTMAIWVKHNGSLITGSIMWGRLANALDYINVVSISQAQLSSGDTIQLVIKSNKNAVLTPEMVVTYADGMF